MKPNLCHFFKRTFSFSGFLLVLALMLTAFPTWGATIAWSHSGSGNWSDASNWTPSLVPGASDTAFVTNLSGSFTVTIDTNAAVFSLTMGGNAVGSETLAIASGASLSIGNTLNIASNCPVTVALGGTLNLASTLNLLSGVTNAGTINMSNTFVSVYYFLTNTLTRGAFVNLSGGLVDFRGDTSILPAYGGGQGYFINQGTLRKSAGAGMGEIDLNNFDDSSGSVDVKSGSLSLEQFNGTLAGTFNAAAGTEVYLSGGTLATPVMPGTPLVLGGSGLYSFSGVLFLPTDIIPGLVLNAGTLELGPSFQGGSITNLALDGIALPGTNVISGIMTATNSTLTGLFTVTNGGTLMVNEATINGLNLASGLNILNGGVLQSVGNGMVVNYNGSSNTQASLTIAGGGSVQMSDYSGGIDLWGPMTNAGTIAFTNAEVSVWNDGGPTHQGSIVNQAGGVMADYGGATIAGTGGQATFINHGTILQSSGQAAGIEGFSLFSNDGTIHSTGGSLTFLDIPQLILLPSSVLNIDISFYGNNGKFIFSTGTGTLNLAGAFGANLTYGFTPGFNALFDVMSYNSFSGSFSSIALPPSLPWITNFGSNQFSIRTGEPITVTNISVNDKYYDGTTNATLVLSNAALVGVASGDSVTLNATNAAAWFTNKNAAYNENVIITGLTLSGTDAPKYALVQPTLTASIYTLELTVTGVTVRNRVYDADYDASIDVTSVFLSGALFGDVVALDTNGATAYFLQADPATAIPIYVFGWALTGQDAGNYQLPPFPENSDGSYLTGDITPKPLTVLGLVVSNKVYDGTANATLVTNNASLSGLIPGDDVSLATNGYTARFAIPNVATNIQVTVSNLSLAGINALDYTLIQPTGLTANITAGSGPITLSITDTNGNALLRGMGAPGQDYVIQSASTVEGVWTNLSGTLVADGVGMVIFTDVAPPPRRFYRTRLGP